MGSRWISAGLLVALAMVAPIDAFEGRLVNTSGAPMVGARIQLLGGRGSVVADADGRFTLQPTPALPFFLLITRPDGVLIQPLKVESLPEEGELELEVEASLSGSLTVQGGSPDLELPPAAAVTVVGRADLARRSPDQIDDVLAGIPGTGANGSGHTAVPSLRGLASARTLMLLDEGRITSERRAGPSATFVDPASLDEVEVVRGPGSVAYGSDAMGGLIRMRTRVPSPGEPFSLRYGLVGSTNDRQRSVDADASGELFGGGFMVGGSYRKFDNYSSPEGEIPLSGYESMGLRTGYQHAMGPGLLRFLWRTDLARDVGKAAANSDSRPTTYPEEDSHRASLAYEQPGPGTWSRLAVSLFWDEYRLLTEAARLSERSLARADVFSHDYGARFEIERPLGAFRLMLGVDLSGRYGLHATNRTTIFDEAGQPVESSFEVSIEDASKDDLGVFAGLATSVGAVSLSGGVRVDRVETRNSGGYFGDRSTSNSDVSGFVGASVPLGGGFDLSAQVARGFRDPLLSDRYYRGISGRGFITGNPELESETSLQGDISLRYTSGTWILAGYLYDYRIDRLIERTKNDDDYYFHNRGEAEVQGIELEAAWAIGGGLTAQLAAQLQDGEAVDENEAIDGVPPAGVLLTLRHEPPSVRWWWFGRIGAYASNDDPGPNEVVVPGYAVVDAAVGYRINRHLELQLLGRNLLDQSYFSSADDNAVMDPGRTVVLSVRGRS